MHGVTPVSGERGALGIPGPSLSMLSKAKKKARKIEVGLKVTGKVGSTARSLVSAIDGIKKVSSTLMKISKLTKVTGILLSPFSILGVYEEGVKIVEGCGKKRTVRRTKRLTEAEKKEIAADRKKDIVGRVRAAAKLLTHVDAIVDSVAAVCSLIYLFKPAMEKIIGWIPIFSMVSFFVGLISFFEAGETTWKGGQLVRDLKKVLAEVDDPHKSDQEKARILEGFLTKFQEKDIKPLFKRLAISGKATTERGVNVRNRIETLVNNRLRFSPRDVAETTEILRTLAGRAKLQFGFELTDLVNKVVSLVGKIFIVFVPPLALVGFIILATTGIVSLVMMGARFFFVTKNPFDPASETRARHIVALIENAVGHLRERLKSIFSPPQTAPAIV